MRDLTRSVPRPPANARPRRRIAPLGVALALVAALAGCQMTLYEDLSQDEANVMTAALLSAGVPAERAGSENGFAVLIDEADMPRAMAALEAAGLPRQRFDSLGDVFAKDGLLSSPTEERARLVYATSQELSETLSQIDGVLSARIHVVLPEEGGRPGAVERGGSASVFLRHQPELDVDALIPDIKMLVTRSIANLAYDQVSVIRVAARTSGSEETPPMLDRAFGIWVLDADAGRLGLALGGLGLVALLGALGNAAWFWMWRTGRLAVSGARAGAARSDPTPLTPVPPSSAAPRPPRRAA